MFAPLHHDRHIFPRTVAAVLMLKRSETSLSVSLGLKLSIRLIRGFPQTKSFEYEPQTIAVILEIPKDKGTDSCFTLISALFILTRLAGIEEDEDLLTACVSDVRSVNMSLDTLTMSLCIKMVHQYPPWDTGTRWTRTGTGTSRRRSL